MLLLARTTPRDQVAKDRRAFGLSAQYERAHRQGNDNTSHPHHDQSCDDEIFFDDLHIPADSLIGEKARLSLYPLRHDAERILIAAECRDEMVHRYATAYAKDRVVFGNPIGRIRVSSSPSPGPMHISQTAKRLSRHRNT